MIQNPKEVVNDAPCNRNAGNMDSDAHYNWNYDIMNDTEPEETEHEWKFSGGDFIHENDNSRGGWDRQFIVYQRVMNIDSGQRQYVVGDGGTTVLDKTQVEKNFHTVTGVEYGQLKERKKENE